MALIYRLEFDGKGIYEGIANVISDADRHLTIETDLKLRKAIGNKKLPNFLYHNPTIRFAFADLKQLVKWFNHYERNKLRELANEITEDGKLKIKLLTINIKKKYVKYGDTQVIYYSDNATIISEKNF